MRTIIRNARVITFDDARQDLPHANILIDGAEIVAVGADAEFPPDTPDTRDTVDIREIDGSGRLALPGLINGHFHSPANLMKGAVSGLPLEVFMLYEVPPLSEQPPDPRTVYVRTLLGAIEMVKRGVTSVQDDAFFVPYPDEASVDALMQAYADVGMRATVALDQPNVVEYEKFPFLEEILPVDLREAMRAAPLQSTDQLLELCRGLINRWHGAHEGRLRAAVSCSAPHRVTTDYFEGLSDLSRHHDLPFYMHILETRLQRVFGEQRYGKSLVRHVHELGHLGPRVNVIHGIWVDDADMDIISEHGCTVAHNPVCNLRLGSGIMPFRRLRDRGIDICLGSDEMLADDTVNLWAVAKMAGMIHTITDPDYHRWPQASELLDCLFAGGARAMGLAHRVARIAPGFAADIVLLDLDTLAFTPLNDLHRQLVYCEDGSSVRLTMVAGEIVVDNGRVLTCDEDAIKREARVIAEQTRGDTEHAIAAARRLEPYYREMYLRATRIDVGIDRWAPSASGR